MNNTRPVIQTIEHSWGAVWGKFPEDCKKLIDPAIGEHAPGWSRELVSGRIAFTYLRTLTRYYMGRGIPVGRVIGQKSIEGISTIITSSGHFPLFSNHST